VDYYLRVVIVTVQLIELGIPAGRSLNLSRRSHLWGNTPNIPNLHRTSSHNYSLIRKKLIYYSSPGDTHGKLNYPSPRSDTA
jgi:hypothetical protein